jgi:parallel beta-helix repeat protein
MHPTLRTLLAIGALVGSLVASLPASVSAATVTTRWVDDDGKVSSTSCNGTSKSAYKTIQKGVDAANAADVVKVCPGTYVGKVAIKGARSGLVLRAATSTTPVLKARDDYNASTTYLITVDGVSSVTIRDIRIRPLRASSHSYCSVSTGIRLINAKKVSVLGTDIRPSGSGAFCGVYDGITASSGTTGTIKGNTIRDYRDRGIDISGAGTSVTVSGNSVTYAHVGLDPAGDPAIAVGSGATAKVLGNTLTGPASGSGNPPMPPAGIRIDSTASGISVRDNTISRFASGIRITHAQGGTIQDNTIAGGQVGINLLDADDMDVSGNSTSGATLHGLYVAGQNAGQADGSKTTGATVHDNDFRTVSNAGNPDCKGETAYTATSNTFSGNLADSSDPATMCDDDQGPA